MPLIWPNNFSLFTAFLKRPHQSAQTCLPRSLIHGSLSLAAVCLLLSPPALSPLPIAPQWSSTHALSTPSWWDGLWLSSDASYCHVLYETPASPNCLAEPCHLVSWNGTEQSRMFVLFYFLFSYWIVSFFIKIGLILFCRGNWNEFQFSRVVQSWVTNFLFYIFVFSKNTAVSVFIIVTTIPSYVATNI